MNVTHGLVADTISFSSVDGPGNRFVIFLQGCNFNCIACHNPYTISRTSPKAHTTDVGALLEPIRRAAPFLSGITVSGGEATVQADFVGELFRAVKADPELSRLTCFVDSNGSADTATWDALAPVMDGAMIDLKCLNPVIHRAITHHSNEPVLESIRQLAAMGLLYEVRLLLLAGVNDGPELLRRTAAWLAEVDPAMRVKLIGFRHHGARRHSTELVEPTPTAMYAAADLLREVAPFDLCVV